MNLSVKKSMGLHVKRYHFKKFRDINYASSIQPMPISRHLLDNLLDQTTTDTIGIRDRALLAFMFASGGRRRIEAEEARIEHLEDLVYCFLFHMPRSDNLKPVSGLAAKYLRKWLELLGEKEGPLFRYIGQSGVIKPGTIKWTFVNEIVKKLAEKSGQNPKYFPAHLLRSSFVIEAGSE